MELNGLTSCMHAWFLSRSCGYIYPKKLILDIAVLFLSGVCEFGSDSRYKMEEGSIHATGLYLIYSIYLPII